MKLTKIQIQQMMWNVRDEITTMKNNLKNSKDYLNYLNDCLKDIEKEEQEKINYLQEEN